MALSDFSHSLPMLLYRALDAVMPRFRRIFNEFGLTEQQGRVLRALWERNGISVRELADVTLIPAPSLVGVLDRLQKNGLIERRRSATDRRVTFVSATESGLELQARLMPAIQEAYSMLMQSLEPREWIRLVALLDKLGACDDAPPG